MVYNYIHTYLLQRYSIFISFAIKCLFVFLFVFFKPLRGCSCSTRSTLRVPSANQQLRRPQ